MLETKIYETDFCVIGGGMAGVCAAIAAARNGVKTVLMQDRPMLGGNASSEIRMWICGAHGENNRETGLIEEIMLESLYKNPDKSHYLFDCILLEKVRAEPNLTLLLNCSCMEAETDRERIVWVKGWQGTTQTFHQVHALLFADCSGDSILAPLTGAHFRFGREAAGEFGEQVAVQTADRKTMGISCLLQGRLEPVPSVFIPPSWTAKLTPEQLRYRRPRMHKSSENFWYLEYGGELDCIRDAEEIRDRVLSLAMGMWDYIKNSGEVEDGPYWKLDFLGFLPAKRESRRMMGRYLLTQQDVLSGGRFPDTVAYGGWGLDDHDPGGFFHEGKPNHDQKTPAPYGIPFRCLYSENIRNLLFAGRNISATHAAMSSSRVMATCAVLGEAVGTAAAVGIRNQADPEAVYRFHLEELQRLLMDQDCFLPHFRRIPAEAVSSAALYAEKLLGGDINRLRNGIDRNNRIYGEEEQGCFVEAGSRVEYIFGEPMQVASVRVTFDSDLDRLTLPGDSNERKHITRANIRPDSPSTRLPSTLVREYRLCAELEDGSVETVRAETENRMRTVRIPVGRRVRRLTLIPIRKWYQEDDASVHLFSFDFN